MTSHVHIWQSCLLLVVLLAVSGVKQTAAHTPAVARRSHQASQKEAGLEPGLLDKLLNRSRRWDFSNGCHCHGYHMECMRDVYCQHKHHSEDWKCEESCCGFACVKGEHHDSDSGGDSD